MPEIYYLLDSYEYIAEDTLARDIGPKYYIDQDENKKLQSEIGFSSVLSVKVEGKYVVAVVNFLNRSDESLYIYKKDIPSTRGKLCGEHFLITTDNIKLDYLGGWCDYGEKLLDQDWIEIPAKHYYFYKIFLGDYYAFLPGEHYYNIGGLEQVAAGNTWFIEKNINRYMFFILNGNYANSSNDIISLPLSIKNISQSMRVDDFLFQLGYYGKKTGVFIRTNEVIVKINGAKVKSYYAKGM